MVALLRGEEKRGRIDTHGKNTWDFSIDKNEWLNGQSSMVNPERGMKG